MTDMTAAVEETAVPVSRLDVTSEKAVARLRARYRAEARFRAYGLAAVAIAALFLIVLIGDIIFKALPAFTQHQLVLDVPVSAEAVDRTKPAAGDFDKAARDGLLALFPQVKDRRDRRRLTAILSSRAADLLRAKVVADPELIGETVKASILLNSDSDLYLKGLSTRTDITPGAVPVTVSGTQGTVDIIANADVFLKEQLRVKKLVAVEVAARRREAERLTFTLRARETDVAAAQKRLDAARAKDDAARVGALENELAAARSAREAGAVGVAAAREAAEALQKTIEDTSEATALMEKMPSVLVFLNGGVVKATKIGRSRLEGEVLVPLESAGPADAGEWRQVVLLTPQDSRKIQDAEVAYLEALKEKGAVRSVPNTAFFAAGDSREPELAGILGALSGSSFTMLVTLVLCLPAGVAAAIFLEEFAPKNRLTYLIEVNINNLAAVPSIVFGLLGLAVFLNFFGLPRSSPLVGGLVLALLVLPTIIIASRAALKAVPPSIREAALGVGASHQQAVFHHVLPLAMPGIMTGTIIGMAHALGETAPLLLIGMIAFIVDVPSQVTAPATVLPVQIFLWSDLPEAGFQAKTAAAILVLLAFLFVMNGAAIWLRKKFERRW